MYMDNIRGKKQTHKRDLCNFFATSILYSSTAQCAFERLFFGMLVTVFYFLDSIFLSAKTFRVSHSQIISVRVRAQNIVRIHFLTQLPLSG